MGQKFGQREYQTRIVQLKHQVQQQLASEFGDHNSGKDHYNQLDWSCLNRALPRYPQREVEGVEDTASKSATGYGSLRIQKWVPPMEIYMRNEEQIVICHVAKNNVAEVDARARHAQV